MSKTLKVQDIAIRIVRKNEEDFISLTDMVKSTEGDQIIKNWLRNKGTLEFLGTWEQLHNPIFNVVEFDHIRMSAGVPAFVMSVQQWVGRTAAIGMFSKAGRYGGTFAHRDIAFEFGSAISPLFKLLLIKEFQRLKDAESKQQLSQWDYRRFLAKVNYRVHTDAIKDNIIPRYEVLTKHDEALVYANEAEMLNVAVFGMTSKQWRTTNEKDAKKGLNIRDLANAAQLTVISNLESLNAHLISENLPVRDRFEKLKSAAVSQLNSLSGLRYIYSVSNPHHFNSTATLITQSGELPSNESTSEESGS